MLGNYSELFKLYFGNEGSTIIYRFNGTGLEHAITKMNQFIDEIRNYPTDGFDLKFF